MHWRLVPLALPAPGTLLRVLPAPPEQLLVQPGLVRPELEPPVRLQAPLLLAPRLWARHRRPSTR